MNLKQRVSIVGFSVPDFKANMTGEKGFQLSEFLGKNIVLYFYPKNNTPGCTAESLQFRDMYLKFKEADCEIFGISRDTIGSHQNFKTKLNLPFELISDPDEIICRMFDVIVMKSMYGKKVKGIERSTFLIDIEGKIIQEWRNVKVDNHASLVLENLKSN
tara:strand:+ start:394 stop:873 length:480 start_codon:yes stop_codon:yes gene_type:complete